MIPPALLGIAKFLGPYAASLLFNRIGAGAQHGQAKQIQRLLSPENISMLTNRYYDLFKQSPMYAGLRTRAMAGANTLASGINARAYRSGLGSSGLSAIAEPLARSSFLQDFQNIDANAWQNAFNAGQGTAQAQARLWGATPSIGAGTWGGFLEDMGPILQNWMQSGFGKKRMAMNPVRQYQSGDLNWGTTFGNP